jgi:choline dehydrogenase-like flavoprotein
VLLVEAGGANKDVSYLVAGDRYTLAFKEPTLNWGYKTVPQPHLKGQEIDYSRGKGLGGSSAINFCCWVIGPSDDFDEWAERVGDDAWSWKNVKSRFGKIESYHVDMPEGHKFLKPKVEGEWLFWTWGKWNAC